MKDDRPATDINTVFIEWVYKIDLDNLIFHVNAQPMFRLDNMPPSQIFLESGHTVLREDTHLPNFVTTGVQQHHTLHPQTQSK